MYSFRHNSADSMKCSEFPSPQTRAKSMGELKQEDSDTVEPCVTFELEKDKDSNSEHSVPSQSMIGSVCSTLDKSDSDKSQR